MAPGQSISTSLVNLLALEHATLSICDTQALVARSTCPRNQPLQSVIKILLPSIAAIAGAAIAFLAGPTILGRTLTVWELGLISIGFLIATWSVLRLRDRWARSRALETRDSALW